MRKALRENGLTVFFMALFLVTIWVQTAPGDAAVSLILECTPRTGVGPRLHKHPYAETFLIRRGSATFTIGSEHLTGRAGQVLVVPAETPHTFSSGPDGYEAVHIHANPRFLNDWLE